METNKKTNEPEEHISLASARQESVISSSSSDVNTTTNTYAAPKHTHVYLKFQDTATTGIVTQLFNNEIAHFHFDTNNPKGHKDGQDGSYYMTFASTDTKITGTLYENGKRISGPNYGHSIEFDIMLPFKNNYEFIVEPDDMSNTVDITADISYSTGQGEQLEMVNSNTKYITILKDQIKVLRFSDKDNSSLRWESSNASVISIGTYSGIMTAIKTGSASISVSDGCGYFHVFHVKSVIDYVDIMPDEDGFNKVVFRSSGKVWHCINHDMIFDENNSGNRILGLRVTSNYMSAEPNSNGEYIKTYSDDELRLLYNIDPYGVAKYVQGFADRHSATKDIIKEKDRIFTALFNREPTYFVQQGGQWRPEPDNRNIDYAVSESETLFGYSVRFNIIFITQLISIIAASLCFVLGALGGTAATILSSAISTTSNAIKANFLLFISDNIDVSKDFKSLLWDTIYDISGTMSNLLKTSVDKVDIIWAKDLVSQSISIGDLLKETDTYINFNRQIVLNCAYNKNYEVSIVPKSGKTRTLRDLCDITL